jgi:hypothetical protein
MTGFLISKNEEPNGLFPSKTGFLLSKNERYRVKDLVTLIIFNIGFRVCK